jgi:hypothetical protein
MKADLDPEQVTQPLEIARQAGLVGGASGTHSAISQLHIILHCCSLAPQFNFSINVALSASVTYFGLA